MFLLSEIVEAVSGKLTGFNCDSSTVNVTGVSKDTRTIEQGDIYIALRGENFDGHNFCEMAIDKGASCILISDESFISDRCPSIVVEDTLDALGKLANFYRFKIGAKVVAVTGSVGKTSTREMIATSLASSLRTYSTKRNENNEIGLPMTILTAPADTEVFVLEMGMRLRGEISYLTNIACPDIAVITNVGYCHIERLHSRDEIGLAKLEIVEGLTPEGTLIINGDDDFLVNKLAEIGYKKSVAACAIGAENIDSLDKYDCSAFAKNIAFDDGITFDAVVGGEEIPNVHVTTKGIHNVRNATFALLCAKLLGADMSKAVEAISEISEMKGRGAVIEGKKFTVIDDAYNAAPESMAAAFFNLNEVARGKRKVLCLGGMLELGDYAPMLHESVGQECGKYDFDHIFVTGEFKDNFIKGLNSSNKNVCYTLCEDSEDVYVKLMEYAKEGDVILFKASNAFGFQKLASRVVEEE